MADEFEEPINARLERLKLALQIDNKFFSCWIEVYRNWPSDIIFDHKAFTIAVDLSAAEYGRKNINSLDFVLYSAG